jgi:hypothetical protein
MESIAQFVLDTAVRRFILRIAPGDQPVDAGNEAGNL